MNMTWRQDDVADEDRDEHDDYAVLDDYGNNNITNILPSFYWTIWGELHSASLKTVTFNKITASIKYNQQVLIDYISHCHC